MAAFDRVLVDVAEGVATVTLNRPEKLNAFDVPACAELAEALRMVTGSAAVRVVIVTGAGRAFCAGADLGVLAEDGPKLVAGGNEIVQLIRGAPQPVIAAVNGAAAGGGASLALACDYRVASREARIGQVFHRLGLVPDWGSTWLLPRLTGISRALELVWSARLVAADEAQALGLFDRVVAPEALVAEARALAAAWAAFPPEAVRRAKALLYGAERATLAEALGRELAAQNELLQTPEARERIGKSLTRSH